MRDLGARRMPRHRDEHVLKADIASGLDATCFHRLKSSTKRHSTVGLDAVNRRGRHITCEVTVTPLLTRSESIHGAILLMEDHEEQQRRASRDGRRAAAPVRQDGKRSR